jgi:hypothetical protein
MGAEQLSLWHSDTPIDQGTISGPPTSGQGSDTDVIVSVGPHD